MQHDSNVTRRTVLKTGAGGALGGLIGSAVSSAAEETQHAKPDVYKILGVKTIINAAGTITTLGGSLMPPEVVDAWNQASRQFVKLLDLQERVGERIAKLLDVEAALVTTGAAGGIMVGTAAAVTYRDRNRISQLPLPPEMGIEVIRQKSHHDCYDNQVKACGVKLIDVETLQDLERAVNPRTAMMMAYNFHEDKGQIKRPDWVAAARKHGVPTLLDAAADTPPLQRLSEYNKMGYDMVVFSGGKAIRGPQNAGLLLGRKDLIDAAKRNTAPYCSNIGRGLKVSKETMVAMWAAVERFVNLDHQAQWREWERQIKVIVDTVKNIPTVRTEQVVPPIANHVPHLLIHWDEKRLKVSRSEMKQQLAGGDPSIATARV
ncbi:MAG: aminotransferase class V-fold PLP-dependent enzyme, partial [Planctomycetes bacterium]|nr:aminotransferase class V-fold PLP-dependent enzyme [Planctomycetota bacterium]